MSVLKLVLKMKGKRSSPSTALRRAGMPPLELLAANMINQDCSLEPEVPSPDGAWVLASSYDRNAWTLQLREPIRNYFLLKPVGLSVSSNQQSSLKTERGRASIIILTLPSMKWRLRESSGWEI